MPRRSARIISHETQTRLIATMRDCRHAASRLCGPVYEAATALMRRIDDMVGVLTGNREHYWQKAHGSSHMHGLGGNSAPERGQDQSAIQPFDP